MKSPTRLSPLLAILALSVGFSTMDLRVQASSAQAATDTAGQSAPAHTDAAPAEGAETSKVKVERGTGGRKVYKIEEMVIEGKIQKPEAFYVLQKSGINYDWHELKQEFVPKILDSVMAKKAWASPWRPSWTRRLSILCCPAATGRIR
jgi:hypothetical protein